MYLLQEEKNQTKLEIYIFPVINEFRVLRGGFFFSFLFFFLVCSEASSGEVYSIHHYMIKFVSDLRHVGGYLWVLRFPPLIN